MAWQGMSALRLQQQTFDVAQEIRILSPQQWGKGFPETRLLAPLQHVVPPGVPAALLARRHVCLEEQQVGTLKQRDQHGKDEHLALLLLGTKLSGLVRE